MTGIDKFESTKIMRQRADWSDLRIFYAVAETGSFSEAAAQLGLTQPTVSVRIRDLETRLGVRLFVRSPHRLSLTEAGEKILDHVVTMERSAAAVERLVTNEDKKDEGRVIVAAPDGLATYILVPELPRFFREHPDISVGIDCGLWTDSEIGAGVDVSLQFDEITNQDVVATPIGYYHYCLYSSQAYLDLYGTPTSLAGVAERRYLHHVAYTRQQDNWAVKLGALQGLASVGMATNSSSVIVEGVRNGAGIALLPTAVSSFAPDLVMLDLPPLARLELRMCVHRDLAGAARIRRVTNWLKEVFDPKTKPWFRAEFVHPSEFFPAKAVPKPAIVRTRRAS
ncbi:MAG TPA: LysR family transcriptional regulator [Caulobacteraceae bacterium]|jgi:DNA-binding transcriptional LysR family regulator|nr:LysR family transcriptional regulator [Caulobacteraceae bacterium]